jgi:hypothetical protein
LAIAAPSRRVGGHISHKALVLALNQGSQF